MPNLHDGQDESGLRSTIYVPCELRGDTLIVRRCVNCGSLPEAMVGNVQGRIACYCKSNQTYEAQVVSLEAHHAA